MLILRASMADERATVALWHEAGLTRPWNDPGRDFARGVDGDQSDVLLAKDGDRIVGSVLVGDDGHRGWMYYLAVAEDVRGHGVGTALVHGAEDWLAQRGQTRVRLMVRAENLGVVEFYGGLGYADQDCIVLGQTLTSETRKAPAD